MSIYNENNPIRIILADDHEIVRVGIKKLLQIDRTLQVIDEASNGQEAIDLARIHKPDVILLDIFMPRLSGIEAIPGIREVSPQTYIVMLTAFEDFMHLEQALLAGADGYLSKSVSSRILIEAVHNVLTGERVFSKSIINLLRDRRVIVNNTDESNIMITRREKDVLEQIALGLSNTEISLKLELSVRTIETHRHNLIKKLGLKNASQLVRFAVVNSKII